ncbi:hypothetical protein DOY81_013591 [Sarcophaga bullata]|nr:hypothetical protein DOY81_013591 [Sarcophaga bullata]
MLHKLAVMRPTRLATFDNNAINNKSNETHRLTKRMDLESCLGQFDVHKNTIIRTGESQAMVVNTYKALNWKQWKSVNVCAVKRIRVIGL